MDPTKLKKGDRLMIVAPAFSLRIVPKEVIRLAEERLFSLGLEVTYGGHVFDEDELGSSSIQARLDDLHQAFADKSVGGILAGIGGYNSNFLLDKLDWELIGGNPKFFGGFSDITVLLNAIWQKTGMVTYMAPNLRNFGQKYGYEYTLEYFRKVAMTDEEVLVRKSDVWSDDKWMKNQEKRKFLKNEDWWSWGQGMVEGAVVGGNLCSLNLLQGTKYMPSLKDKILFLEDDDMSTVGEFSRNLRSLAHLKDFEWVKGVVFGRFQKKTKMKRLLLGKIIDDIPEMAKLPIMANLDFGHTDPKFTVAIGARARLELSNLTKRIYLL